MRTHILLLPENLISGMRYMYAPLRSSVFTADDDVKIGNRILFRSLRLHFQIAFSHCKSGMQYQVGSQWQWWWHAAASAANGFSESAYYMPAIQEIQLSGAILDGVRFARRAAPLPCHVKHGRGLTFNK